MPLCLCCPAFIAVFVVHHSQARAVHTDEEKWQATSPCHCIRPAVFMIQRWDYDVSLSCWRLKIRICSAGMRAILIRVGLASLLYGVPCTLRERTGPTDLRPPDFGLPSRSTQRPFYGCGMRHKDSIQKERFFFLRTQQLLTRHCDASRLPRWLHFASHNNATRTEYAVLTDIHVVGSFRICVPT